MKKADQWSGLALVVLSAFICWGSTSLPYGNIHDPGPGFMPFWLGIILTAMSGGLILKTSRQKEAVKMIWDILGERVLWGRVLSVLVALALYSYSMDFLGFLTVTFLFMVFLFRFVEPQPWRSVLGWALVGSLGSYLIFEVWMKLRLPKGFLGI